MTIFWDWNGTLVDDVDTVVRINNQVFARHGYPPTTAEEYRRLFRFPVIEYYRDLGVTDEDFRIIAREWNEGFVAAFPQVPLKKDVAETLRRFHAAGFSQVIISASQQDQLRAQVKQFPGLNGVFDAVLGLNNVYAVSKVELAREYLARSGVDPANALFIGDTTHDAEVAAAISCPCRLISGGHQMDTVLATAGVPVLQSLTQLYAELNV
ncbi:MAG: HAD family hydrolase [Clostridiales bacterium]|nr:HAD family hydrolase [Clostridiales bacterium]